MASALEPSQTARRPRDAGGVRALVLHLFLSLLFCLAMGQAVVFNYDTTYEVWIASTVLWGVIWLVFAALQITWWRKRYEKFWRPVYAWSLLGGIVLSLIFLPLLLWPRFRRWLFRVMKPVDREDREESLRALAQLRDEGIVTSEEFEAKKRLILSSAPRPPGDA